MKNIISVLMVMGLISCKKEEEPFDKYEHFIGQYSGYFSSDNGSGQITACIDVNTIGWNCIDTEPFLIDDITEFNDDYISIIDTIFINNNYPSNVRNISITRNYTMYWRTSHNSPDGWVQEPTTIVQLTKLN